ncbi:hypothetical protein, partial [Xenorhabdus sp. NBAII XenSa04]|uniref:hypothetical protein n=1 Tax=Xenorhabdus sp. NBAII XenSa04 TaxID=1429873 RepID=UPI001E5B21EB
QFLRLLIGFTGRLAITMSHHVIVEYFMIKSLAICFCLPPIGRVAPEFVLFAEFLDLPLPNPLSIMNNKYFLKQLIT